MPANNGVFSNIFPHEREVDTNVVIEPPPGPGYILTSPGQSPTGITRYVATPDPLGPLLTPANAGKVIGVNTQGDALTVLDALFANEITNALLNNNGYIGSLTITRTSDTEISISPFTGVIANPNTGSRLVITKSAETFVSIPSANSHVVSKNITYVLLNSAGQIVTTETAPTAADLASELYLCEVFHPNGGPIESIGLVASSIDNLLYKFYTSGRRIGLIPNGFDFLYAPATGALSQTGTNAYLWGYNINASGGDPHRIDFSASVITAEYFSYDSAQSAQVLTNWIRSYKVDNPATGTSTALGGQKKGIIVLYVTRGGNYFALAPQRAFANYDEAESQRITYLSQVALPPGLDQEMTAVALIIVDGDVTVNATGNDFSVSLVGNLVLSSGSVVTTGSVPSPSSGAPGSFLKVNAAGTGFELVADAMPDASAVTTWKALAGEAGSLVYKDIALGDIFISEMSNQIVPKIGKFNIAAGAITNKTSELNELGTMAIAGNKITITANNIFGYLLIMLNASGEKVTLPIFNLAFEVPNSINLTRENCTCYVFFNNLSIIS